MSRILDKKGILQVMYGSAYLSTGAGGPLKAGLKMLELLEKEMEPKLKLFHIDEMTDNDYAVAAIGFGSPDAFLESDFGIEAYYAYRGIREELIKEDKKVSYLYSLEYAGFNTFVPMYVAMMSNTPFLDVDANGKAIPTMEISLHKIFNEKISPVVLANNKGDIFICRAKDPTDTKTTELFSRKICEAFNYRIGYSSFVINKNSIKDKLIPGAISFAQKVGKIILECKENKTNLLNRMEKVIKIREICCGEVSEVIKDKKSAYNIGTIVIESKGQKFYVDYKNEILVVRSDSKVLITVPEIISMIDIDNYYPITTSEVKVGANLSIAALPSFENWWRVPEGFECYRGLLKEVGYEGTFVKY